MVMAIRSASRSRLLATQAVTTPLLGGILLTAAAAAWCSGAGFVSQTPLQSQSSTPLPGTLQGPSSPSTAQPGVWDGLCGATALLLPVGTACAAVVALSRIGQRQRKCRAIGATQCRAGSSQVDSGVLYSTAVPFLRVPPGLKNDPLNTSFPGDFGFDPLGFASPDSPLRGVSAIANNACASLGLPEFDALRWYREAELMHGRVAMLAVANILVRETGDVFHVLPDRFLEQSAWPALFQTMTLLEAYRAYRLFVNTDKLAGDLGLGMGVGEALTPETTAEQLAEKQLRELLNGRLAMVSFLGMVAQYNVTGYYIVQGSDITRLEQTFGSLVKDDLSWLTGIFSLWFFVLVADGIRRLAPSSEETTDTTQSSIAQRALNPLALNFGVQDPGVPLPAGLTPGSVPQQLQLSEEQVRQFEEDGVIMIPGAMRQWVDFLVSVTEHQISNPHVWSLVGRMSGLYDYIQRNMWMTNNGFRDFIYYSPLGHVLSQLGRSPEIRVSTDMLLVNPNKGFSWHQDNQNGPIDFPDALRWWVAMDPCGQNDFGAPEYLLGSHRNQSVDDTAVFVNLQDGDLSDFTRRTLYKPMPGDLIVWDSRTIHRIVAPPTQRWEDGTQRRAFGGTAAKSGAIYLNKGGASAISDLAGHSLQGGESLNGPYFPQIYPERKADEEKVRAAGGIIGRSPQKMVDLGVNLASNAGKYLSFTKVVGKKE